MHISHAYYARSACSMHMWVKKKRYNLLGNCVHSMQQYFFPRFFYVLSNKNMFLFPLFVGPLLMSRFYLGLLRSKLKYTT